MAIASAEILTRALTDLAGVAVEYGGDVGRIRVSVGMKYMKTSIAFCQQLCSLKWDKNLPAFGNFNYHSNNNSD